MALRETVTQRLNVKLQGRAEIAGQVDVAEARIEKVNFDAAFRYWKTSSHSTNDVYL